MHNFMYLAQRRSQEFSCEPNFAPPPPLGCASVLRTNYTAMSRAKSAEPPEMLFASYAYFYIGSLITLLHYLVKYVNLLTNELLQYKQRKVALQPPPSE